MLEVHCNQGNTYSQVKFWVAKHIQFEDLSPFFVDPVSICVSTLLIVFQLYAFGNL